MKISRKIFTVLIIGVLCMACQGNKLEELDLLSYGMPITIEAPMEAEINANESALQKSVQIDGGEGYHLLIYQSDTYASLESVLKDQKQFVQENPYFDSFLLDEEDGFIYKIVVDSTFENYNFRHIKHFGGKEYTFQAGIIDKFNEDQIRELYSIAKKAK